MTVGELIDHLIVIDRGVEVRIYEPFTELSYPVNAVLTVGMPDAVHKYRYLPGACTVLEIGEDE